MSLRRCLIGAALVLASSVSFAGVDANGLPPIDSIFSVVYSQSRQEALIGSQNSDGTASFKSCIVGGRESTIDLGKTYALCGEIENTRFVFDDENVQRINSAFGEAFEKNLKTDHILPRNLRGDLVVPSLYLVSGGLVGALAIHNFYSEGFRIRATGVSYGISSLIWFSMVSWQVRNLVIERHRALAHLPSVESETRHILIESEKNLQSRDQGPGTGRDSYSTDASLGAVYDVYRASIVDAVEAANTL